MANLAAWVMALVETAGGVALILGVALPIVALMLAIDMVVARIEWLLSDDRRLRSMGERARAWSRPDAANALARTVLAAGDGG